ncbi:MAG: hypothetical protein WCE69_09670, partial [Aestuariivirga sp.]
LSFLHDFDITDKHKLLLPAVSIADSVSIKTDTVENRTVILDGGVHLTLVQFEDGAELARLKVRNPNDVVDVHLHLTFQVIFQGQPGPLFVVQALEDAIDMVEAVAADFAPLL